MDAAGGAPSDRRPDDSEFVEEIGELFGIARKEAEKNPAV
jgi:hypothetical protein